MKTIFWMIVMLGINIGGFIYFANLAAKKEKMKSQK